VWNNVRKLVARICLATQPIATIILTGITDISSYEFVLSETF
jgi:hypothetical protein